jgi:hypothetical protein
MIIERGLMKTIMPGHRRDNQFPFYGLWWSPRKHFEWRKVPRRPVSRPAKRLGPNHYLVVPNYAHLIRMYSNRKPKR